MWSLSSMRFGCYGTDGSANQESGVQSTNCALLFDRSVPKFVYRQGCDNRSDDNEIDFCRGALNVKQPWGSDQPAANTYVDPLFPQAEWRYREHLRAYKSDPRQDGDICCRYVVTEFQGTRRDAQPDREQPAAPIFPL